MATPDINDLQQQTDLEQAKAKLQEVAETKEARKDPRIDEKNALIQRQKDRLLQGGRVPDEQRDIREGKVPPKKKKFSTKLKEALFNTDAREGTVADHIFFDIIVPTTKRLVYESLNTALCMVLGLDPKNNRIIGSNTHTANASLYRTRGVENRTNYGPRKQILGDCEWDEETAKDYFSQMLEVVDKYDDLSISNVYSICGLQHMIRTTDRNWGWTRATMTRADVYAIDNLGERWVIDLPEPRPLNR